MDSIASVYWQTSSESCSYNTPKGVKTIKLGTVQEEDVAIDDELDKKYKPGLYKQTIAFLNLETDVLCNIKEQADNIEIYYKIANY